MKKSPVHRPGIITFHQAKFKRCITIKPTTQTMYTKCQIQTLAEAMSFERFTRGFSSSVTKSFTSSTDVLAVSAVNKWTSTASMMMYSSGINPNIAPKAPPAIISIGINLCTVLDSANMILRPLFESEMLRKMLRKTFDLSGFSYFKELTPFYGHIIQHKTP